MYAPALALILSACTGARTPANPPEEPPVNSFEATVRIDPEPAAKRFQGVWLDREGADPLLVSYRALSVWTPFDGHRVTVTGEQWSPPPEAQQVDAAHFRVEALRLTTPSADVPIHSVGPERTLTGQVETLEGEPGTKMEGSTWHVFATDVGTWQIWDAPDLPMDTTVTVTAREVEVSPFSAHMPGPTLWIGAVE